MLCAEGGQDIYRLLSRDPASDPLSAFELAILTRLVQELAADRTQLSIQTILG